MYIGVYVFLSPYPFPLLSVGYIVKQKVIHQVIHLNNKNGQKFYYEKVVLLVIHSPDSGLEATDKEERPPS